MALSTRKKETEQIEIPMSSMIDVVFLLLIYFVWTYQIEVPEAHLQVNLPGAPDPDQTVEVDPPPPIQLQVLPKAYYIGGRKVEDLNLIEKLLRKFASIDEDTVLIIQVTGDAPTRNLVELLDRCKAAGLTNLNVVTI